MAEVEFKLEPDYQQNLDKLTEAYEVIVNHLQSGSNITANRANFEGSANRAAKALLEMCWTDHQLYKALADIVVKVFPMDMEEDDTAGLVMVGPTEIHALCPHHLLPWSAQVFISVLPDPKVGVLGLSKYSRISDIMARRPVLQEQYTRDLAQVFQGTSKNFPSVKSQGSAVTVIGVHSCARCRGVKTSAKTVTSELTGVFKEANMESRFFQLVQTLAK